MSGCNGRTNRASPINPRAKNRTSLRLRRRRRSKTTRGPIGLNCWRRLTETSPAISGRKQTAKSSCIGKKISISKGLYHSLTLGDYTAHIPRPAIYRMITRRTKPFPPFRRTKDGRSSTELIKGTASLDRTLAIPANERRKWTMKPQNCDDKKILNSRRLMNQPLFKDKTRTYWSDFFFLFLFPRTL